MNLLTTEKRCPDCDTVKPVTEFYLSKGKPYTYCKGCSKKRSKRAWANCDKAERAKVHRAWVEANRERVAGHKRKSAYGITEDEFQVLLTVQGGQCAVCRQEMDVPRVDHDHATGNVRGLLCDPCNKAIGFMRDDPERLVSAARYLKPDIFEATYEPADG